MTLNQRRRAIMASKKKARLPAEYQEIEYIHSSGTQYIDTGISDGFAIEMQFDSDISVQTKSQAALFGCENSASPWRSAYVRRKTSYNEFSPYSESGLSVKTFTAYGITNILAVCLPTYQKLVVNNVVLYDQQNSFTPNSHNVFLLANNSGGTAASASYRVCNLYSCKMYKDSTLENMVRDFVPCYRKSDSVVGLFDLVSNTFFTNAGTGTFTKGADV